VLAGQLQPNEVLGQEHVGDPRPGLGLVIANPHELRGREPGDRVVARDLDEPLRPDHLADQVALRGGPLVVPQDRRAEHPVRGIEQDRAMHLSRQAHRLDGGTLHARRLERRPDRLLCPVPPQ
jgi:hypothetical protein